MNKSFYLSLAKTNIKRNRNAFFPFALSSATMIALFYMIDAIYGQVKNNDANFYGQGSMEQILSFGVIICGIFAAGVIFYTNRFLIKQRSKELGLYSILGMEKRHISKVLFFETAVVGAICISAGLFFWDSIFKTDVPCAFENDEIKRFHSVWHFRFCDFTLHFNFYGSVWNQYFTKYLTA